MIYVQLPLQLWFPPAPDIEDCEIAWDGRVEWAIPVSTILCTNDDPHDVTCINCGQDQTDHAYLFEVQHE